MGEIDYLLARAQISLARLTLIGFIVMLVVLLILMASPGLKPSAEIISLVSAATGSLGTILAQQNGYFFARHRQQGIPDPVGDASNPTQPPAPAAKT